MPSAGAFIQECLLWSGCMYLQTQIKLLLTEIHHSHDCAWHYSCKGKGRSLYPVTQSLSSDSLLFLKMQSFGKAAFGGLLCTAWCSTTGSTDSINPIHFFLYTGLVAWHLAAFPCLFGPTLLPAHSADQSALQLSCLPGQGKDGTCSPVPKPFLCFFHSPCPNHPLAMSQILAPYNCLGCPVSQP